MNFTVRFAPDANGEWLVNFIPENGDAKTLMICRTEEEALTYANGFVDGWRKAMSLMPRLSGPLPDWDAIDRMRGETI